MPSVDAHAPGTPSWFDLMTPDPDRAMAFYSAVLGWEFTPDSGPDFAHYRMALAADQQIAAGLGKSQDATMPSAWTVYMATDDVESLIARVEDAGGTVMAGPHTVGESGRMAIFADPTGAVFGAWEPGQHTGAQVTGEHGAMAWCEVNTRDAEAAHSFYAEVLDYEASKMEGMDYWTLERDGKPHCGVLQMTEEWGELPPHWMAYFAVDDADAAAERVTGNGGSVAHGPFDTPFGRICIIRDPLGAAVTLIQLPG